MRTLPKPSKLFRNRWYAEVVEPDKSEPCNIKRVLEKDVISAIGMKPVAEVTPNDVLAPASRDVPIFVCFHSEWIEKVLSHEGIRASTAAPIPGTKPGNAAMVG